MPPIDREYIVAFIAIAGTLLTNFFVQWLQRRYHPNVANKEGADAAAAWEALNAKAIARIAALEQEIEMLKKSRVGPFRLIVDISTYPEARIVDDEIFLLQPSEKKE
jgi:hypothetical protein